jgi:hypothetical protein
LKVLAAFAVAPDGNRDFSSVDPATAALPLSAAKLRRMLRSAEINQFVSFTD